MNVLKSYRNRIIYFVCAVFIIVLSCIPVVSVRAAESFDTSYPHTDSTYKYYFITKYHFSGETYIYHYVVSDAPIYKDGKGYNFHGYTWRVVFKSQTPPSKNWTYEFGTNTGSASWAGEIYESNHDIYTGPNFTGDKLFQGAQTPEVPDQNPDVNPDTSWTESLGSVFLKILILVIGGMLLLISLLMLVKRLVTWFRRYLTA